MAGAVPLPALRSAGRPRTAASARRRCRPRSPAARCRCRSCRTACRRALRSRRAAGCGGTPRSRTAPASRPGAPEPPAVRRVAVGAVDHLALLDHVGQPVGQPGGRRLRRRGRRGRSPGSSPRPTSAGPGGRRTGRRACRCPCRTRWWPPSPGRPRAGTATGSRRGPRRPGRRGTAARGSRWRRGTRGLLHRLAGEAVDDAGVAGVLGAQQRQQLVAWACPWARSGTRCWAGRSSPRTDGRRAGRAGSRSPARWPRWRSRSARSAARSGQRSPSIASAEVVGAEVVAPLRHAVRLVDGEQRDAAAVEQLAAVEGTRQPLGRQVEQVELAGEVGRLDRAAFGGVWVELRNAARTPSAASASTWSCISAISGEMTTPVPGRTSAGTW